MERMNEVVMVMELAVLEDMGEVAKEILSANRDWNKAMALGNKAKMSIDLHQHALMVWRRRRDLDGIEHVLPEKEKTNRPESMSAAPNPRPPAHV